MVLSNRGLPEPDNPSEDLSPNNEIIMATDTDTEDEDNTIYNDYQPLSTVEAAGASDEDTEDSDSDQQGATAVSDSNSTSQIPDIMRMDDVLVKEVWGGPAGKSVDIVMDREKVDEVKQAMMNFSLPQSSIPEWANNISEEQWKERLMDRLQNKNN